MLSADGGEMAHLTAGTLEDQVDAAAARLAQRWTAMLSENTAAEKGWRAAFTFLLVGEAHSGDPEKGMAP